MFGLTHSAGSQAPCTLLCSQGTWWPLLKAMILQALAQMHKSAARIGGGFVCHCRSHGAKYVAALAGVPAANMERLRCRRLSQAQPPQTWPRAHQQGCQRTTGLAELLTGPCMAPQEPRHQVTLLCFLGTLVAYVERVGFSIAFTEMAKQAGTSEAVKGAVLSAFYWGYSLSQVSSLSQSVSVAWAYVS